MTIKEIKKVKYGYKVSFDDITTTIEDDVVLKYMLSKGKDVTTAIWAKILKENDVAVIKRKGLVYLKNMHSVSDFKAYIRGLGADEKTVESLTDLFKKNRYLDDEYYAKTIVSSYRQRYGKAKIKAVLAKKGVHKDIIDKLDIQDDKSRLEEKIDKAILLSRKPNYNQMKNALLRQFTSKGYDLETVNQILESRLKNMKFDSTASIRKDAIRLLKKYELLEPQARQFKIKQLLYQKGYSQYDIEETLMEMGENDV